MDTTDTSIIVPFFYLEDQDIQTLILKSGDSSDGQPN